MFGQVISPRNPYTKSFVASTETKLGLVRHCMQQKAPTLSEIIHEEGAVIDDFIVEGT